MRTRTMRVIVATATIAAAWGCGGKGGGTTNIAEPCGLTPRGGWSAEVYDMIRPAIFFQCPAVVRTAYNLTGTVQIDVKLSVHGGSAGWVGTSEMWTKNLVAGNSIADADQFAFSSNAPYLMPGTNEQPIRGQFTLTWTVGQTPASGQREVDSLDVQYPTNVAYGGSYTAGAYLRFPVRVDPVAGAVIGSSVVAPNASSTWRVQTSWDTSGYRYQWYLGGVPLAGDTGATITRSFSNIGTYALRVDQTALDGGVLSTSHTVQVPVVVSVVGPTVVSPYVSNQWSASILYGTSPYSYQWTVDNVPVGTGATLSHTFNSPSSVHSVQVSIVDAQSHTAISDAGYFVSVNTGTCDPNDPNCFESRRSMGNVTTTKSQVLLPPVSRKP